MKEYKLNITNCYPKVICLDNNIGLKTYFSILDAIDGKGELSLLLNNLVINIDDEAWYSAITKENKNSIVSRNLSGLNINELDMFTLMLRQAKLTASGVKCIYIKLSNNTGDHYHSIGSNFFVGDKYIWLAGCCSDLGDSKVNVMLVFDGEINLSFYESDIVIESINYNEFIGLDKVNAFNEACDLFISLKNTTIENLGFNEIKSELLEFDNNIKYFDYSEMGNVAIKNYNV